MKVTREAIKKYNKSVVFDQFMFFILIILVYLVMFYVLEQQGFILTMSILIVFICFSISDKIFGGRSLGKRLYGISISNIKHASSEKNSITLKQTAYRRILELIYNPFYYNDQEEAWKKIQTKTNTKIFLIGKKD